MLRAAIMLGAMIFQNITKDGACNFVSAKNVIVLTR